MDLTPSVVSYNPNFMAFSTPGCNSIGGISISRLFSSFLLWWTGDDRIGLFTVQFERLKFFFHFYIDPLLFEGSPQKIASADESYPCLHGWLVIRALIELRLLNKNAAAAAGELSLRLPGSASLRHSFSGGFPVLLPVYTKHTDDGHATNQQNAIPSRIQYASQENSGIQCEDLSAPGLR
jgi:hypothetical protein